MIINKATKNFYSCTVRIGTQLLHSKNYPNLSHIAKDLGLTYTQVTNIYLKLDRTNNNFKYKPNINIKKIE